MLKRTALGDVFGDLTTGLGYYKNFSLSLDVTGKANVARALLMIRNNGLRDNDFWPSSGAE